MTEEQIEVLEAYKQYQSCRLTTTDLIETLDKIDYKYYRLNRIKHLKYVDELFDATVNKNKDLKLNTSLNAIPSIINKNAL